MESDHQKKAKILIVDDQLDNLRLLSKILINQGYEVRKAVNGSTALMGVKTFIPDLILLDVNMPDMNGYEVCQQLKNNRQTNQIPIIFLSAFDKVTHKVKAFEVGGVDYITKPFQVPEVVARVKTQIKINQFNKMRENLSRAIVHDLKNPLSIITFTSSSLIRKQCVEGNNLKSLKAIKSTAQRLDSMLNDILMVAKMDADHLILHKTKVELNQFIINILNGLKITAQAKQISLVSKTSNLTKTVSVDVNLLQRAIENLLSNAIKFAPVGSNITLEVNYSSISNINKSDAFQAIIKVIDEGVGIKQELKQKIFEPYNTGDYITNVPQIGLGLSFCKMVAEAHEGKIWIEDNHPQGAIFIIELISTSE